MKRSIQDSRGGDLFARRLRQSPPVDRKGHQYPSMTITCMGSVMLAGRPTGYFVNQDDMITAALSSVSLPCLA